MKFSKRTHIDDESKKEEPPNKLLCLFDPSKRDAADKARIHAKSVKAKEELEAATARLEALKSNSQIYTVPYDPVQDDMRIAIDQTASVCKCLAKNGFVIMKSPSSPMLPYDLLQSMYVKAEDIQAKISSRLDGLEIPYSRATLFKEYTIKSDRTTKIAEVEVSSSFKFNEVSSRCFGRLDIRYGMREYPFTDPLLNDEAPWLPVVFSMLGEDAVLKYAGLITSFPGSCDQPWHGDGPHLFESRLQCPSHALNVFIPLHDISASLGPTEFVPGSHKLAKAKNDNELLQSNPKSVDSIGPLLEKGTILVYDYRVIHRGTKNISTQNRHMFYLLYTKPWFNENINFGETSIFSEAAINHTRHRRVEEDPNCAGVYDISSA
jgi:hypothetical protein